jgi:hypothetical protein
MPVRSSIISLPDSVVVLPLLGLHILQEKWDGILGEEGSIWKATVMSCLITLSIKSFRMIEEYRSEKFRKIAEKFNVNSQSQSGRCSTRTHLWYRTKGRPSEHPLRCSVFTVQQVFIYADVSVGCALETSVSSNRILASRDWNAICNFVSANVMLHWFHNLSCIYVTV